MRLLSIVFFKINFFPLILQFCNINTSQFFLFFYPFAKLVQYLFMIWSFLYLEIKCLQFFILNANLFFILSLFISFFFFSSCDFSSNCIIFRQILHQLFFLSFEMLMIFQKVCEIGNWKFRLRIIDMCKSLCDNLAYLWVAFQIINVFGHFNTSYKNQRTNKSQLV